VFTGTFDATDEHFGAFSFEIQPSGPAHGVLPSPASGTSVKYGGLIGDPGISAGTYTLTTGVPPGPPQPMDPCGYALILRLRPHQCEQRWRRPLRPRPPSGSASGSPARRRPQGTSPSPRGDRRFQILFIRRGPNRALGRMVVHGAEPIDAISLRGWGTEHGHHQDRDVDLYQGMVGEGPLGWPASSAGPPRRRYTGRSSTTCLGRRPSSAPPTSSRLGAAVHGARPRRADGLEAWSADVTDGWGKGRPARRLHRDRDHDGVTTDCWQGSLMIDDSDR
jgi:hypothetical protein